MDFIKNPRFAIKISNCIACLIFLLGFHSIFSQIPNQKEIDKLFENFYKLGSRNADSTYSMISKVYLKSKEINYESGIHRAMALSITYLTDKENYDSAKLLSTYLLNIVGDKKYTNDLAKAMTYLYTGNLHRQLRDFEVSRTFYLTSLPIFEKLNDNYFIGVVHGNLGGLEYSLTNYNQSLTYYLKAYEIKLKNEIDPQSYAGDLYGIGICYYALGHKDEARRYATDAYTIMKKSGLTLNLARVSQFIGVIWGRDVKDSAIYYLNQSIMIAERVGNQQSAFIAKRALSHVYGADEVAKSNAILIELLNDSTKVGETLKGRQNKMLVYSSLAFNCIRSKEFRKCVNYARKALILIEKGNSPAGLNPNLESLNAVTGYLGGAYEGLGIYDSALYFNRAQIQVKDTLNSISERKRFTKLYSQIENLENDLEINSLENQKVIDARNQIILLAITIAIVLVGIVIILMIRQRYKFLQKEMIIKRMQIQHSINKRERDFEQQALAMINLNNRISEFEDAVKLLKTREGDPTTADFQMLLNKITVAKSMEIEWKKFEDYFSNIHKDFIKSVYQAHPDISTTELRLIALIRLGLSIKEMANILNVESKSINIYKYRLRKKFNLNSEDDLDEYLERLQSGKKMEIEVHS